MFVLPVGAQAVGDILNNLPVRAALAKRLEDLVETLDAPLGAGKGPLLFQTGAGGQDDIRKAAGLG